MDIYQYVQTPMNLANSSRHIVVQPESSIIAINNDRSLYSTFSLSEIGGCSKIALAKQDLFWCPKDQIQKRAAKKTSFNGKNMNTAKVQVCNLKIAITTLKSMGFEDELLNDTNLQNTFLLTELEAKIPVFVYSKWVDKKEKLKEKGKTVNIEEFCSFYEKIVETQNDAVYIRNRLDELEGSKKVKSPKASRKRLLATKVKAKNKSTENHASSSNAPPAEKGGSNPTNKYCIFCEMKGHFANWCKNKNHSHDFKISQVKKQTACLACLRTSGHRADKCPYKKECPICGKWHSLFLHTGEDIAHHFEKKRGAKTVEDNKGRKDD